MTNQKNPIKTAADAKELFQVRGLTKGSQVYNKTTGRWEYPAELVAETRIMTADGIKWNTASHFQIQESVSIGTPWPEGVTVEQTAYSYRNCYAQASYSVKSPKALTDEDFDILRTQGAFMGGQETGLVSSSKETPEGWEYVCRSVCDSGD